MISKGFTLIELMIVVAIIGILSMFALPAYQDYTKRAYAGEAFALLKALQDPAIEFFALENKWPTNDEARVGTLAGNSITSIVMTPGVRGTGGIITVTFNTKLDAGVLLLTPAFSELEGSKNTGTVKWICTSFDKPVKYLPKICQDQIKGVATT